jgi:hypothetical protein
MQFNMTDRKYVKCEIQGDSAAVFKDALNEHIR